MRPGHSRVSAPQPRARRRASMHSWTVPNEWLLAPLTAAEVATLLRLLSKLSGVER